MNMPNVGPEIIPTLMNKHGNEVPNRLRSQRPDEKQQRREKMVLRSGAHTQELPLSSATHFMGKEVPESWRSRARDAAGPEKIKQLVTAKGQAGVTQKRW